MEMDEGMRAALLDMSCDMPAFGLDELPPPWNEGRMGDSDQPDMDSQDRRVSTQIVLDGVDKDVDPMEMDQPPVPANETPAPAPRKRGRPRILPEDQRRKSQRVEDMPEGEREYMQAVARYLARLRSDIGYTNDDILQRMQDKYPGVALQTLSRLQSPNGITERGDVGHRMLRAALYALKSSFGEMEQAIADANPAYPSAASEEMQRLAETERAVILNLRRMSPLHREVLLHNARTFAQADSGVLGTPGDPDAAERAAGLREMRELIDADADDDGMDREAQ